MVDKAVRPVLALREAPPRYPMAHEHITAQCNPVKAIVQTVASQAYSLTHKRKIVRKPFVCRRNIATSERGRNREDGRVEASKRQSGGMESECDVGARLRVCGIVVLLGRPLWPLSGVSVTGLLYPGCHSGKGRGLAPWRPTSSRYWSKRQF